VLMCRSVSRLAASNWLRDCGVSVSTPVWTRWWGPRARGGGRHRRRGPGPASMAGCQQARAPCMALTQDGLSSDSARIRSSSPARRTQQLPDGHRRSGGQLIGQRQGRTMPLEHAHEPGRFDPGHCPRLCPRDRPVDHYWHVQRQEQAFRSTWRWARHAHRFATWALWLSGAASCWPSSPCSSADHRSGDGMRSHRCTTGSASTPSWTPLVGLVRRPGRERRR
jgi:hypothetical protein